MEMEREGIREPYREPITTGASSYLYPVSRIGWGAVIAGFFIATVTQILLNVLGIAIGLTAVGAEGSASGTAIGIGAGVWTVLSSIISVFVGAWVAGRYTSIPERGEGSLQGALVWSLSLIFFVWIAASGVGSALSGIMGMVGKGVQAGAQGAAQGAASKMGQDQNVGRGAGGGQQGADRESKIQNLMSSTGMSREQAEKAFDQLGTNPEQMKQQAAQAAETTAKYGAAAAWWFFITSLLSLGAAIWGGSLGFSRRDYYNPRPART